MTAPLSADIQQLPAVPSRATRQAVETAAGNQHALINLTRLIKSLESKVNNEEQDDWDVYANKRDWETVLYARTLLDTLTKGNEQSSKTTSTLSELTRTLDTVEQAYRIRLSSPAPTPLDNPALIALPMSPIPSNPLETRAPIKLSSSSLGANGGAQALPATISSPPGSLFDTAQDVGVRKRRAQQTDEYLARRTRQSKGDESALLPLKDIQHNKARGAANGKNNKGDRDQLLGDTSEKAGLGSAQLHEELGGQLADMSYRLKMNAVHFANSLEDEKALLDDSTDVLEKNLASTRSSKKQLGAVSKKGKGTTCLTLGVVIFVLVVFVWTYLLIRFT